MQNHYCVIQIITFMAAWVLLWWFLRCYSFYSLVTFLRLKPSYKRSPTGSLTSQFVNDKISQSGTSSWTGGVHQGWKEPFLTGLHSSEWNVSECENSLAWCPVGPFSVHLDSSARKLISDTACVTLQHVVISQLLWRFAGKLCIYTREPQQEPIKCRECRREEIKHCQWSFDPCGERVPVTIITWHHHWMINEPSCTI